MRNIKVKMIKEILPDKPSVDDIVVLIETGVFGVSLESIRDSEVEGIWDMDEYSTMQCFEDSGLYTKDIEYVATFEESIKFALSDNIDIHQSIEDNLYIYEDLIYQTLECMTIEELKDLLEVI